MAYDSPFSGPYGGAGPALPPGYMEMATQPGRDVQGLLKSIGEKFKERREKKKQEAKELKATRSLAKALGVERLGLDESSIETADVDTIMGRIQALAEKRKERELEVQEAPEKRSAATVKVMQHMLGGQAEQLRAQDAYGAEPGGPGGGPLDEQEANKLRAIESILPHMEGMEPSMIETILELSQGGGTGAGTIREGPGGSMLLQTGRGTFSVLKGVDKEPSPAEMALARERTAKAEGHERFNEMMKGIQAAKVDTSDMDQKTERTVTKLEADIQKARDNVEMLEDLSKKHKPYANWDGGKVVGAAEVDKISAFNAVIGEKSTSSSLISEKQKLEKLQKQLNKLRADSGGAAIPRPPLFDVSPENLFE